MNRALLLVSVLAFACGGGLAPEGPDGGSAGPDGGAPRCGDGVRQGTEECDLGAANGPNAGCEKDCTRSCIPGDARRGDARCDPHDPCKGRGACGNDFTCSVSAPLATGAACGDGKICRGGACQAPVCGDGIVTAPEECDDGVNDGKHGCTADCRFTCVPSDPARSCAPADPCQGAAACDGASHTCSLRTPLADGTSCGASKVCRGGACVAASCGDGIVEPPEECDPPDGVSCDSSCRRIVHAVCGNGVREPGEQCDDGNLVNLDGCDSTCHFEEEQRANAVKMQFGTGSFCTVNALGSAIGSLAQSKVQAQIDAGVASGSMTMAFQFLGLADLSGTNAASVSLAAVTGTPAPAPPMRHYDGAHDLDWWYAVPATDLDALRVPKAQLAGQIRAKSLTAGPGSMALSLSLGSGPVSLAASGVRLRADVGPSTAPTASTAATPGHAPGEHLDPALRSFDSLVNGELCGNVTAGSLAQVPAPAAVQSGGSTACDEGYRPSNSMLDVIVRGCTIYGFLTAIAATQPDQVNPGARAVGAGGPYRLSASGASVDGCRDVSGASVDLALCLRAAAYSSFLSFASGRVVLK